MRLPLAWLEWIGRRRICARPDLLTMDVPEPPDEGELRDGFLLREVRDGYEKWAHFRCPRCREHIRVPLAGAKSWKLKVDWLRRPSLHPSVWQTGSCGAHFFVRKGRISWVSVNPVWIFVYGSLMSEGWEKEFGGNLVGKATIRGFHRAFNKKSIRNWGSRDAPAPTLALEPDGLAACTGLVFRFPDTSRTQVLEYLAEREGQGFTLEGLEAHLEDGSSVIALTPMNDPRHHTYLGRVSLADRARMANVAVGELGTCISYVENLQARLRDLRIADQHVEEFCKAIADL